MGGRRTLITEAKWSSEVGGTFRQAFLMSRMVEPRSLNSAATVFWFTEHTNIGR